MVRELPLALLRFGVLALLWLFVLAAIRVIRSDLLDRSPVTPPAGASPAGRPEPAQRPIPQRSRAGRLVVTAGPLTGTVIGLDNTPVTFGRSDACTLVLADDYVSSQHARLTPAGEVWILEDLGSTNGTYLAEQQVTDAVAVPLGAPIRMGRTVLELRR